MFRKIQKYRKTFKARKEILRDTPSEFDNAIISWVAPEFIQHHRGIIWKIIMGAIVISAAVIGIFYNSWTFSLAIVTFAVVYWLFNREKTKVVEVVISQMGIKVGTRKYPFGKIKGFWINYNPPISKSLFVRVDGDLALDIEIQLNTQNPAVVREILIDKIPEFEGKRQSTTDIFLKLFKL
jgi:hypothetical protein